MMCWKRENLGYFLWVSYSLIYFVIHYSELVILALNELKWLKFLSELFIRFSDK